MTLNPAVSLALVAVLALGGCMNPYPPPPSYYPQGGYPQQSYSTPPPQSYSPPLGAPLDLADTAAGVYHGDVISDARGSGRSGVTIVVAKSAPDTVTVTSDYGRLPPFTIRLTRAMNTIQQVGGSVVFLLDLSKGGLDITDDDASWAGSKA